MKISFSKIDTYSKCGLKYYFKYVEKIIVPPTVSIAVGRAVHHSLEKFFEEKKNNNNPSLEFMLDVYSDKIDELFKEELLFSEEEKLKGIETVKGETKDAGAFSIKVFHKSRASLIEPFLVEQEFEVDLNEIISEFDMKFWFDEAIKLVGYVDLASANDYIHEFKIKTFRPKGDEADKSQQLTIYALGFKEITGTLPQKVMLECLILPRSKSEIPKVVVLESKRTNEDLERLLKRIVRIVDGIHKGVFIPPDQSSWICQYCEYRKLEICKEYLI